MTSSLVGSEMCIRDRLMEDQDGEIPCHDADEAGLYGGFSDVQAEEDLPPCLLYTSDAADDM
eukprot:11999164-Prorocentrum_lima.AAC.1